MAFRGSNEDAGTDDSGRINSPVRIEKPCRNCGEIFSLPRCRDFRDHFCSRKCGDEHRAKEREKRRTECPKCGKSFIARVSQLKDGKKPNCSVSCGSKRKHSKESIEKRAATWHKGNHKVRRGEEVHNWKGGIHLTADGYYLYSSGPHKGRNVHTVIMEQHIGRRITKNEVVHHINHIKTDNRIENLQLMTRAEHIRLHLHGDGESE